MAHLHHNRRIAREAAGFGTSVLAPSFLWRIKAAASSFSSVMLPPYRSNMHDFKGGSHEAGLSKPYLRFPRKAEDTAKSASCCLCSSLALMSNSAMPPRTATTGALARAGEMKLRCPPDMQAPCQLLAELWPGPRARSCVSHNLCEKHSCINLFLYRPIYTNIYIYIHIYIQMYININII